MQVQYMSFSAHADAKGIMQLIRMCDPGNVLLVHGESVKMDFLKSKINKVLIIYFLSLCIRLMTELTSDFFSIYTPQKHTLYLH